MIKKRYDSKLKVLLDLKLESSEHMERHIADTLHEKEDLLYLATKRAKISDHKDIAKVDSEVKAETVDQDVLIKCMGLDYYINL